MAELSVSDEAEGDRATAAYLMLDLILSRAAKYRRQEAKRRPRECERQASKDALPRNLLRVILP
jgi:hypothetical protein